MSCRGVSLSRMCLVMMSHHPIFVLWLCLTVCVFMHLVTVTCCLVMVSCCFLFFLMYLVMVTCCLVCVLWWCLSVRMCLMVVYHCPVHSVLGVRAVSYAVSLSCKVALHHVSCDVVSLSCNINSCCIMCLVMPFCMYICCLILLQMHTASCKCMLHPVPLGDVLACCVVCLVVVSCCLVNVCCTITCHGTLSSVHVLLCLEWCPVWCCLVMVSCPVYICCCVMSWCPVWCCVLSWCMCCCVLSWCMYCCVLSWCPAWCMCCCVLSLCPVLLWLVMVSCLVHVLLCLVMVSCAAVPCHGVLHGACVAVFVCRPVGQSPCLSWLARYSV